jgi:hypothetical protein
MEQETRVRACHNTLVQSRSPAHTPQIGEARHDPKSSPGFIAPPGLEPQAAGGQPGLS